MNDKLKSPDVNNLFNAILTLKDLDECYDLFEDLCTVAEIKEMAKGCQTEQNIPKYPKLPDFPPQL